MEGRYRDRDRVAVKATSRRVPPLISGGRYSPADAVQFLDAYNHDVAAGKSTYDKRADNLIAFLDRVAADLGSVVR